MDERRYKPWVDRMAERFDENSAKAFSRSGLGTFLEANIADVDGPKSITLSRFVDVMTNESHLSRMVLRREGKVSTGQKPRYVWRDPSPYSIAMSIRAGAYLSHASALFLHALTEQLPKTLFVNREQSPKPPPLGPLSQRGINLAFKRKARRSTLIYHDEKARYVLLSGKNTENLGVIEVQTPFGETVETTSLERTLIDVVVRPAYSGGVYEVNAAYQEAAQRVDIERLATMLKELDHKYPYHQAIGFLLTRAGVDAERLRPLGDLPREFDFYLDYQMQAAEYDPEWRLFYPQGM